MGRTKLKKITEMEKTIDTLQSKLDYQTMMKEHYATLYYELHNKLYVKMNSEKQSLQSKED